MSDSENINLFVEFLKANEVHRIFVTSPREPSAASIIYDPAKWSLGYGPTDFTDINGPYDEVENLLTCDYSQILKPELFEKKVVNRWGDKEWVYKGNANADLLYKTYDQDEQDNVEPVIVYEKETGDIVAIAINVD